MSLYDYNLSQKISARDEPFYALIMAAMRKADFTNVEILKLAFPRVWKKFSERYWAPEGRLFDEEK